MIRNRSVLSKNSRSRLLIAGEVVLFVLLSSTALAIPPTPHSTLFGSGTAWNVATAGSGVAADSGANGAWLNPASLHSSHNELLGEGDIWGDISTVRGASPPLMRYGAGAIHYLNQGDRYSWAILYTPLSRQELGLSIGQTEVVNRSHFNQFALAMARDLGHNRYLGFGAAWTNGASESGVLVQPQDGDTLLHASLFAFNLGYQQRGERWNIGLNLQSPRFGTLGIERSLNVVNTRETIDKGFRDTWSVRAGVAHKGEWTTRTLDLYVSNPGFSRLDGDPLAGDDWTVEISASTRAPLGELVGGAVGLSWRLVDPDGVQQLTFGLGGSYEFSPDLTLYGGAGVLLGVGGKLSGTLLDDATPWVLRGGAIFHGD